MAQQPEASSTLFMSQFTDDAVRDAIARVSLSYHSIHVASSVPYVKCINSRRCEYFGDFTL